MVHFDLICFALASCSDRQGGFRTYRQASFCLLCFQRECLGTLSILHRIDTKLFLKLFADGNFESLIPIKPPQVKITAAGQNTDFILLIFDERKIERATTEINDHDGLCCGEFREPDPFGSQHETQCCSNRFIDNIDIRQTSSFTRFGSCLALNVAELGRNRDDGTRDGTDFFPRRIKH